MTAPLMVQAVEAHNDDIQREVPRALAIARHLLGGRVQDAEHLAAVVNGAMELIDSISAETMERTPRKAGCMAGCASCCYQEVTVSTVEVVALVAQLVDDERPRARAKALDVLRRVGGRPTGYRYTNAIACPFLERTTCGIYAARPQACRTHFSMSRSACDREWRKRLVRARHGEEGPGIPMPSAPKAAGFAVMLGMDAAVHELGLEVELVELSAGVAAACEEGAIEQWLSGHRIFAGMVKRSDDHPYSELLALTAAATPVSLPSG